jgi:hypothetical protein
VKRAFVAAAVIASSGCARNAFLELTIELPKDPQNRFAVTQVMAGATDFTIQWGGDNPVPAMPLDANGPKTQKLSIEGNTDNESTEIRAKVTFCKQPDCLGPDDDKAPAVGLKVERAFYIGKRTSFPWKIACIPGDTDCTLTIAAPTVVTKCQVAGCRAGTTNNHCFDGKHFCEDE